MKLLILCVDGFDPDYARDKGFDRFRHHASLAIPEDCFIESPDGPQPKTGLVWPTIFSGQVQAEGIIKRSGLRKWAHDWLLANGIRWTRGRPGYQVNPYNEALDTVFTGRLAFTWNLPTISPEWIVRFPDMARLMAYCRREFMTYEILAQGCMAKGQAYEVGALYTRIVDAWGHFKKTEDMDYIYSEVSADAWRLGEVQKSRGDHLIMISDHGCLNGVHTDRAYMGATFPFEADNILDVRGVIEGVLND